MVHVTKWRKKPVEIEACEFVYTNEGIDALKKFWVITLVSSPKPDIQMPKRKRRS